MLLSVGDHMQVGVESVDTIPDSKSSWSKGVDIGQSKMHLGKLKSSSIVGQNGCWLGKED